MTYYWALLAGIIGIARARCQPAGMARALFATAFAQAIIFVIVLMRNLPVTLWTAAVWRGFAGNMLFAMLFAGAALLWRKAGRRESVSGAV